MHQIVIFILASFINGCKSVCQFQNPFYFVERPSVVTVVDSSGQMVADRLIIESFVFLENNCLLYQGSSELGSGTKFQMR